MTTPVFALPARLAAKADPALIAADEQRFAEIADSLTDEIAGIEERQARLRREPGRSGEAALERDLEIHRLSARLRTLRRYSVDICLGRFVTEDESVYVGRLGLTTAAGRLLLVDWRSPAAEPFFAATPAHPLGVSSRRRYRWTRGRITDYWDEILTPAASGVHVSPDDESAFIASLGGSRSARMRDVLSTIQTDQDAIVRASANGALVVDGGPGTGKTVVALHRAAYLLYADPRLGPGRGRLLFVGPHEPYLAYVSDVLPSLGEEGVLTCTMRDFVEEGAAATIEANPRVAELKSRGALFDAIEPAVRLYEEPPTEDLVVSTPWADLTITAAEWADAFRAAEPGATHNDARDQVWEEVLEILMDQLDDPEVPRPLLRRTLARHEELGRVFTRAWPLLEASVVVADLYSVPAYLRRCAPSLSPDDVAALQREDPRAWTVSDLPILDAARRRIGDPAEVRRRIRAEATRAAERERRSAVVDHLIAADDGDLKLMSMLRGDDAQNSLDDEAVLPSADPDLLAGPFAHIIVDEAQELTDAQWRMLIDRCPSRSFTIVGDRAQARHGFRESWRERLERVGLTRVDVSSLTVNYRTPEEVMREAEPIIRAALPDANVPTSVRRSGHPVRHGDVSDLDGILADWLTEEEDGVACIIVAEGVQDAPLPPSARVRVLTPELAKGLEFDLVVLIAPESYGTGIEGAVDRYVAMTRATQRLVVLD
ncbi:RNA polymerase recycling motor ATPase HelR [Microbacterium aoyamense]|uniref:RNA polymerase recycling motor ATPase HelR n=1 Tax=Microbacterium aoyamense TaxID=344166 RepID=A0ABP5ATE9_9MICO|nr:RNA polymerase recycling motor ATPase HelR [Microbacterium aoyamense]